MWERRMLFDGKSVEATWQRRTNEELQQPYQEAVLTNAIKLQRVRWMGHVLRVVDNRMPKRVL